MVTKIQQLLLWIYVNTLWVRWFLDTPQLPGIHFLRDLISFIFFLLQI
jgi:hypothetical protein